jgi:hypothetical protein
MGVRKPFMQCLAEMPPDEVAALPAKQREVPPVAGGRSTSVLRKGGSCCAPAMQIGNLLDNGMTACFCLVRRHVGL